MERSLAQPVADPTYLEFFGLTQSPFAHLPDPCQLFHSEQYSLLMEHLANAAANTDSLVVINGTDGSGKSTLLKRFVTTIGDQISCVVVDETCHGEEEFYRAFLTQIGFEEITGTASELRNITKEFLVCRGIANDHVLIMIDNAHLADPRILEQLRWLCEIKIKDRRVLSVVLAGNADIVRVVDAPAMRETKFRSHVVFGIRNYSEDETANYVWHRLRIAGGNDAVKLPNEASLLIHRYSGGIPHLINRLCNDMLEEAYGLESRVITEKIVRTVADKQQLLPHVVPPHGKGRRKSDPDFKHVRVVPKTAGVDSDNLQQQIARLSEQLGDLRADKARALQDIDVRNSDITVLRDQITQQNLALSNSATALEDSENRSERLAADLEKETRAREAAQKELAKTKATVEELNQLEQQLQAKVNDVQSDLKVADERAVEIEALEKNTADLKVELEGKTGELDSLRDELASRNEALADLEMLFEESQAEHESAQQRIAALKHPQELEEIERASDKLAADLRKEKRARKAAEKDLAKATAAVEELNQLKQELRATVDGVQANLAAGLKVADERAVEIEALETNTADLKVELEGKTSELDSLRDELALRNEILADLEMRLDRSQSACELAQQRIAALKSPKELEEIERASDRLASDLEKETRAREAAEKDLAKAKAAVEELDQLKQELQATVDGVQADIKVADERAVEIEALENDAAVLKEEIGVKTGELDALRDELKSLRDELASRNEAVADLETRLEESQAECESAQRRITALRDPEELAEIERASDKLAADLRKEKREREGADDELAQATATIEELNQLKEELQAKVDDVQADLKVADERAVEIEALKKNAADLNEEIEGKTGELGSLQGELKSLRDELASRNEAIVDLETRLEESQAECESAQRHITALKNPEELAEVERASDKLAADLRKETRARKGAEKELAKATATVEELLQLKQELQATVDDVRADLKVADERAAEIEALEKHTVNLNDEIEGKTGELDSLRDELKSLRDRLTSRDKDVADLESWLQESQKERASAQLRINALKDPEELEEVERASGRLVADLRKETRAREAAEKELAKATATVEELNQLKQELQGTVRDLNADLKVVGERAVEVHVLDRNVTDLKEELEKRTRVLDSRNQTLADLEKQLEASQNECELLRRRAPAVKTGEKIVPKQALPASGRDARVYSSHVVTKFEQSISNIPAYQTLREYDPAFYDGLIVTYKQLVGLDLTDKQVNDALRAKQVKLMERLLPRASDEAIIAYARLIVDQLDELRLDGTEPCLSLLIPQSSPDNTSPIYSEVTKGRELDTLDVTLRTYVADRQLPAEKNVWPDLGPIFEELFDEFGADNVAAMENSYDPGVDRGLVCNVTRALYSGILKLPESSAANALRWLLST